MKLDLHGVKHADVSKELDMFLFEHMQNNVLQVEVITGKSITMKKIVRKLLPEYDLEVSSELEGSLIIDL